MRVEAEISIPEAVWWTEILRTGQCLSNETPSAGRVKRESKNSPLPPLPRNMRHRAGARCSKRPSTGSAMQMFKSKALHWRFCNSLHPRIG